MKVTLSDPKLKITSCGLDEHGEGVITIANPEDADSEFYIEFHINEDELMTKSNNEWINGLPPVGEVCYATWLEAPDGGGRTPVDVEIMAINKDFFWLREIKTKKDHVLSLRQVVFDLIKTEAEKRRDEMFVEALTYVKHDYSPDSLEMASTKDYVIDAIEQLIDAGWIKPKPLTDEVIDEISDSISRTIPTATYYKYFAKAIEAYIRGEG